MLHKIKLFFFDFFHFNKQERNGVFVLLSIFVIVFLLRIVLSFILTNEKPSEMIAIKFDEKYNEKKNYSLSKNTNQNIKVNQQLFVFNPNLISLDEAMQLGLSNKAATILINFRNKGGKFNKPEDFKKVYGIPNHLYQKLLPYILITTEKIALLKNDSVAPKQFVKNTAVKNSLELNAADSLSIVYLKGIGPGFTKRIMKYRHMLGGFHSVTQLKDVYGMNDTIYNLLVNQINIDKDLITKIPINEIDFNSLRKHPYFNFQTAQVIINYRFKHGKIYLENIKELGIFSDDKLANILPYFSY